MDVFIRGVGNDYQRLILPDESSSVPHCSSQIAGMKVARAPRPNLPFSSFVEQKPHLRPVIGQEMCSGNPANNTAARTAGITRTCQITCQMLPRKMLPLWTCYQLMSTQCPQRLQPPRKSNTSKYCFWRPRVIQHGKSQYTAVQQKERREPFLHQRWCLQRTSIKNNNARRTQQLKALIKKGSSALSLKLSGNMASLR